MRQAVKDYESQVFQATQSLAEYKHRALTAEVCAQSSKLQIPQTDYSLAETRGIKYEYNTYAGP